MLEITKLRIVEREYNNKWRSYLGTISAHVSQVCVEYFYIFFSQTFSQNELNGAFFQLEHLSGKLSIQKWQSYFG